MGMRLAHSRHTAQKPCCPSFRNSVSTGSIQSPSHSGSLCTYSHRLSNDRGPGTGRSHGSREKGPLLEKSPGLGIKIALLVGGP